MSIVHSNIPPLIRHAHIVHRYGYCSILNINDIIYNETIIQPFLVEYSICHTLGRNISRGWKLREIFQPWVQYILIFQAEGWTIFNIYVTGFEKRDLIAHFEKIELLLP